jgi:hypothetical protein
MSDQESNRIRRIVGWGIIGLIVVIELSIALFLYFAPWGQEASIIHSSSHFILAG